MQITFASCVAPCQQRCPPWSEIGSWWIPPALAWRRSADRPETLARGGSASGRCDPV